MTDPIDPDWPDRLEALGLVVRERLRGDPRDAGDPAIPIAIEGGDTIYAIDRRVEPAVLDAIAEWPGSCLPLVLVMEGLGPDGIRLIGDPGRPPRFRMIVDPIDGTRGLMYDKRPAWFLAAVAPDLGPETRLSDAFAAALVELPTSKQDAADSYTALIDAPAFGIRRHRDGRADPLPPAPSRSGTLAHGFAQVASFFPGTKRLAADLMERIADLALGPPSAERPLLFDDQYLSTGGQMAELIAGRDRFTCDLRPLFHLILERLGTPLPGLCCHPYDLAAAPVAHASGVLLTDGFGRPLDAPLDVHSPVHWCGFANAPLRDLIAPVIASWLAEHGIESPL